jgi:hypothetical protein
VQAYEKHIEEYSRITQLLIERPHLNKEFYSRNPEFLALPPEAQDFYNYLALAFGFQERLWVSYSKGSTDKVVWDSWDRWFAEQWFPLELFAIFWRNEGK